MKSNNLLRYGIILVAVFSISIAKSQTITTEAPNVASCPGTITVPIIVTNINSISAISLTLDYDTTLLTWDSFQNEQEQLSSGFLIVNSNGSQVIVSWFSLTPANFGNDTLIELIFTAANPGSGNLGWNLSVPDNCMYTDDNHTTVTAIYKDGLVTIEDCGEIYGNVHYDNVSGTAMNNSNIELYSYSGDQIDATVSDVNGEFVFDTLLSGLYTLDASTSKAWGGVNSTDALGIMRHFVAFDTLSGIRLAAADVDASGFVNTIDALTTAQRFTLTINSFPAGDWLFQSDTVTLLAGKDTTVEVLAICYGDIDGSYIPPFARLSSKVDSKSTNSISVAMQEEFIVPLSIEEDLQIGAISLVLLYPEDDIEIIDVSLKGNSDNESMIYSAKNGELRIAWFNVDPLYVVNNETLLYLKCQMKGDNLAEDIFSVGSESEFADAEAKVIEKVTIDIPKIISGSGSLSNFVFYPVYPNPSNDIINVEYNLPEDADLSYGLFDVTGRRLWFKEQSLSEGSHKDQIDISGFNPGIYYLKVYVDGLSEHHTMTSTIVIGE